MNFSFLLKSVFKKVPETEFRVFSILRGRGITWVDLFCSEMKENFFLHILVPIWVFKMVCKCVLTYFENFQKLRRRAYAWVISERLWFSVGI